MPDVYDTPDEVLASHTPPPAAEPEPSTEGAAGPTSGGEEAPSAGEAPDDPFSQWGGRQNVEDAMGLMKAFQNDGGVTALAVEALQALGHSPADIHAFLAGQSFEEESGNEGPEGDPFADLDDDAILTGADFKRMFGELLGAVDERLEPVFQTVEEQQQYEAQRNADLAVDGARRALGITDPKVDDAIRKFAERHLDPEDWDPRNIAEAYRAGHADYVALIETEKGRYQEEKRAQRDSLPRGLGGSSTVASGSDGPEAEPQTLKEAIERARRSLGLRS